MGVTTPAKALEWEARQGPRAAIAAALGALLAIVPSIVTAAIFKDRPVVGLVDSLERAGRGGGVGSLPSLRTPFYEFYDDHAAAVIATSVVQGLGAVAGAYVIAYLASATRARNSAFRGAWIYVAVAGGLLIAVSTLLFSVGTSAEVSKFLDGPRTVDRAADISSAVVPTAAQLMQELGQLALGLGWVIVCLNAMRVGLLTRFMGILGVIAGAIIVLPILPPVAQAFWLVPMSLLFVDRLPNGRPAAWTTGEAQPWPSQAEVRDARRAEMQRRRGVEPEPAALPAPETPDAPGQAHAPSKKKKRKRRR